MTTVTVDLDTIEVDHIVSLITAYQNRPDKPTVMKLNGLRAIKKSMEHNRDELIARAVSEMYGGPADEAPM